MTGQAKFAAGLIFLAALFSAALTAQTGTPPRPDALAAYKEGNYTAAIGICEQELAENPRNIESYVVLCWSLAEVKRYAEAEQMATKARALNQNDIRIVKILAEVKSYLQKNAESLALFEEYMKLVPDKGAANFGMGEVYYSMGELYIRQARFEHADIALTTAVRYQENNDAWWTQLGYAREMASANVRYAADRRKSYTKAIEAYDKALKLNPNSFSALEGKKRAQDRISAAQSSF